MNEPTIFYMESYNLFITINHSVDHMMKKANIDLTYGQYTLLKFISLQDQHRITQKQLECWSSLRKPSISQLLKLLVKKNYILHRAMRNDNRCKEIQLTAKAIRDIKEIDEVMEQELIQTLPVSTLSRHTELLTIIHQALECRRCQI